MLHVIQRYVILVIGLFAAGFLCLRVSPYLVSSRGDYGPTFFNAQSPLAAMTAFVICLACATAVASVVGRFINTAVGLFVLGAGLFVLDGRLETIRSLAMATHHIGPARPLGLLAIEAMVLSGLSLAAVWVVYTLAGPLKDIEPEQYQQPAHPILSMLALKSALAGIIMIGVVLLLARSPMKGQMIGTVFVGGMVCGLIARLISPHVQPVLIFASPIFFAAIGYLIAMGMVKTNLGAAYVSNALPALAHPAPLDYMAGTIMGVAVGLGWAKSFLHHEDHAKPAVGATGT